MIKPECFEVLEPTVDLMVPSANRKDDHVLAPERKVHGEKFNFRVENKSFAV